MRPEFCPTLIFPSRSLVLRLALFIAIALPGARASRSGLNNVPTADVSAAGTAVVQAYSAFGPARKTSTLTGLRGGFETFGEKYEVGLDSRWEPRPAAPLYFNFKWASHGQKSWPALGLGTASAAPRARDRRVIGQPQTYAVVSHDLHFVRLHAGYAVQAHNNAAFAGLDRAWMIGTQKLTFRADVVEIQDGRHSLASAGFTYKPVPEITFELWESKPSGSGRSYTTAKIGWQFLPPRKL
jgi:hypothetical protein